MPKRKRHRRNAPATPAASAGTPPAYHSAATPLAVARLAARLTDPDRRDPIVVVTVDHEAQRPYAPPADLAAAVGDRAEVWFIPESMLTYGLSQALPGAEFSVYNGAARIYPPGIAWETDQLGAPLLLPRPDRPDPVGDVVNTLARLAPPPGRTPAVTLPDRALDPHDSAVTWVDDPRLAAELGRELLSPERTRPVVVITIAARDPRPFVDPQAVAGELRGIAPVFVLPTGVITWALSDLLVPGTDVYGGASRVYPVGDRWLQDPLRSPLRFATSADEGRAVAEELIVDALSMAAEGGYRSGVTGATPVVSGEVLGISAGRALIRLDNGDNAAVWPELVAPGIPARQVFSRGQRLTGRVDPTSGRLDLTDSLRTPAEALAEVREGDVVLARSAHVERDICILELFPGFEVAVPREQIVQGPNAIDLRRFLGEDEILRVQVVQRGDTDEDWQLSAFVADEGMLALPAPALLPGGPPWLVPTREGDQAEEFEEQPRRRTRPQRPEPEPARAEAGPAAPASGAETGPGTGADSGLRQQLVDARTENARLLAELREQQRELARYRGLEQRAKKQLREAHHAIARLKQESSAGRLALETLEADARRFADPVEQLRFEVETAWARRFGAEEREHRPLADWAVGTHFFKTWDAIDGIDRSKVIDVLVEVLTGLDAELASRELHQLRTGTGATSPTVTRPDGALAWRVSLQVKTPSARRLHYWRLPDGSVEFSSVRLHDDFRP